MNTLAVVCKVAVNEANVTSSLQGYPNDQKEEHLPTEGPCENKNRNQLCGLLELAVAAAQTSTFVRIVPVLHVYSSDHETLPACFRKCCISTHHEPENPINYSSVAAGI